jgi:hypothetical protein
VKEDISEQPEEVEEERCVNEEELEEQSQN